jgi:hypothetical protein
MVTAASGCVNRLPGLTADDLRAHVLEAENHDELGKPENACRNAQKSRESEDGARCQLN